MSLNSFFRRIKKWTIKSQSFWSLGSNGVSALSGLLLFSFSSSRLSSSDFGIWVMFQTVSTLVDMFRTGLLFPGYLQLSAGRSKKTKLEIFTSVQFIFILITIGQCIVCWLLHLFFSPGSTWGFFFENYPWIILSGTVISLTEWWLQSIVRFHSIFLLRMVSRVLIAVCAFFFVVDLPSLIFIQVRINLVIGLFILIFFKIFHFRRFKLNTAHSVKLFTFGKYATPSQMLSNLLRSSDTLMISHAMGTAAIGIYGAAAKFLEFIELPIRSFGAVNFNHLAKLSNTDRHQEAFAFARQRIWITTMGVLPIAFLLGVFAPQIITSVSGMQYASSIPVLRIMAIYCILIPADRYCGLLLESFGRPDLNLIKVFVMLVSNVVGNSIAILLINTPVSIACSSIVTFSIGVGFGFWLVITRGIPQGSYKLQVAVDRN